MANKLGFYLHSFEIGEHKGDLFRDIQDIRPPTMLVHAWDQVDQLRRLSPDSFIIGRMTHFGPDRRPVNQDLANEWLDSSDPEARGREFASHILADNFESALKKENGKLLVDAWMSVNKAIPGPASGAFATEREEVSRRLRAYDDFQIGFREKLIEKGVEAVAFNFGAGNFRNAEDYLTFFPRTLAAYTYLGFHEYGWPALSTELDPKAKSSAGTYRPIVQGISKATGRQYKAVITELGLAVMFAHPEYKDKGWLDVPPPETKIKPVSQEDYWRSLRWFNDFLSRDDFALGACLYEVGHAGDWDSFRHYGTDNQEQPITIMNRIQRMTQAIPGAFAMAAAPAHVTLRGRVVDGRDAPISGAMVRLIGDAGTLGGDPRAVANSRGAVTWTQAVTGFAGSLWNCWQKFVAPNAVGITWEEFRAEADQYNPSLRLTDDELQAERTYFLPENKTFPDTSSTRPEIVWDRTISGFDGDRWECWRRYVQGKVLGLSWEAFRKAVVAENPSLAAGDKRFHAGQAYRLPRTAGQEEYTRVAYTGADGDFAFAMLTPGAYRLEVSAYGFKPLVQSVDATSDLEIVLPMELPLMAQSLMSFAAVASPFVGVRNQNFILGGRTFKFVGVNLRALPHYGAESMPFASQRDQLSTARDMGARVVRVFLPTARVSREENRDRLGRLIQLMKNEYPGMYLIVALGNLYGDVDFRAPGDDGFYTLQPGGQGPHILNQDWFRGGYKQNYLPLVEMIVSAFKDEPTIMAYNVGNELKAQEAPGLLVQFMMEVADRIRRLDSNHLLSTGMISTRHAFMQGREDLRKLLYGGGHFDFITNHSYHIDGNDKPSPEDDSDLARALNKPLLIEEAGFAATNDRTSLYVQEMDGLFGKGASGYMPWGFMSGGNTGDGDDQLGVDRFFHGADFDTLFQKFRERADHLASLSVDVPPPSGQFAAGQQAVAGAGVNIRKTPSTSGAKVIMTSQRTPVTILGGPERGDGLAWWRVRLTLANGQTTEGWIAQTTPNGATLLFAA